MRIDLPQCNFKLCRKCFDGNCIGSEADRSECKEFSMDRSAEPTASEFLRKAKAICESRDACNEECPFYFVCGDLSGIVDEADLVRKVMDYRLEDKDVR